jgi:hypothetical protein
MAPRPDVAYIPPCDLPEPAEPPDPGAFFEALATSFVPDPGRSWEEAQRWRHADLVGLSDPALVRERSRAAFLLTWLPETDERLAWLAERVRAVAAELQRRRQHG